MLKRFLSLTLLLPLLHVFTGLGQPWSYNFGTSTGSYTTASTASLTFLPAAPSGNDRVRMGNQGGGFYLENQTISFCTGSYLRGVAATGTSANKFSVYAFDSTKIAMVKFIIRLGDASGSNSAGSGTWAFFLGKGVPYYDNSTFSGATTFTGLQFMFGSSGSITLQNRAGGAWADVSTTAIVQGSNYKIEIFCNNSTSSQNYTYGTTQSVAADKFDLWVNGNLIGDDLAKATLANNTDLTSFMFYGVSSISNVANIFIDDIQWSNSFSGAPLPVELTSFTASAKGSSVTLNWETKTEVDNNGFEVERNSTGTWQKIGFVEGHGTANSPKYYSFNDNNPLGSKIQYRLKQIDNDGTFEYSPVVEVELNPTQFTVYQNYPNPFNPSTVIRFALPVPGNVTVNVFNTLGEKVATLLDGPMEAGYQQVTFDAANFPSGLYFYEISAGEFKSIKKMLLMK